ncbi:MAG: hypothetical protein QGH11_13470 [Pirellulaceae bacterium]|nr:hypothetical protein [Pirellulaceae bacterium]
MNVTFSCGQCGKATRQTCESGQEHVTCLYCQHQQPIQPLSLTTANGDSKNILACCPICSGPSEELFIRKNFSQRLGLLIIVIGFIASSIAWYYYQPYLSYGILLASALVDLLLYQMVGNLLQCYRCHSEYRGVGFGPDQQGFDLVIHERHRQQEARLAQTASPKQGDY